MRRTVPTLDSRPEESPSDESSADPSPDRGRQSGGSLDFSVEVICLTDGEGRPVPAASRPYLMEHTSFPSLENAVNQILARGDWELVGEPMMVNGHSAVLTVRRAKLICSIHVLPERR